MSEARSGVAPMARDGPTARMEAHRGEDHGGGGTVSSLRRFMRGAFHARNLILTRPQEPVIRQTVLFVDIGT